MLHQDLNVRGGIDSTSTGVRMNPVLSIAKQKGDRILFYV